jgi:endo-alpha-1,4-polygalactosaminidase (GH114 family)
MSGNGDLHAYKKPTKKMKVMYQLQNVKLSRMLDRGISTAVVRPHYDVNKQTKHSIYFITKRRQDQGKH